MLYSISLGAQPYNRYVTVSSRINGVTIQVYYLMTYMLARQHTTLNQSACNALKKVTTCCHSSYVLHVSHCIGAHVM